MGGLGCVASRAGASSRMYLGEPASASVMIEAPSVVYCLSAEALERMEKEAPDVAVVFHRFMAQFLAERLNNTTDALDALVG